MIFRQIFRGWFVRFISLLMLACGACCVQRAGAADPSGGAFTPPAGRTPVTVIDGDGQPLEGVAVLLQRRPDILVPELLSETTVTVTDASGAFMAPPREVGGTYVVLRKDGFASVAHSAARAMPARITMTPGRTVSGVIMTSDGTPIPDAFAGPVTIGSRRASKASPALPRMITMTAADGSFKFDNLPDKALNVQVWTPGYSPRLVEFAPGAGEIKVSLEKGGGTLRGRIVGSRDRAGQPGIPVELESDTLVLYTISDADGAYIFENVPVGTWRLRPGIGGPLSGTQSRQVVADLARDGDVVEVPLVLNQGIILAGRAVDAVTSRPLAGINITLSGYADRGSQAVLTEPDGSFAFENLESLDSVVIRFDPVRFVYLLPGGAYREYFDLSMAGDTDFDLTTLTIPLHRRMEVRGKVVDVAGKIVPDAQIRLQSLEVINRTSSKSGPAPLEFHAYSNGKGEFHTGIYPGGQYKVWAQKEELVSQVEHADIFTTSPAPVLSLRVASPASLEGVLTDASDRIVTSAVVIAWAADTIQPDEDPIPGRENYSYAKSDNEGRFELTGLRGEPLKIRAMHGSYVQPAEAEFDPSTTQPGTTPTLQLTFPDGGEFSVAVVDENGDAVSNAEVALEYTEGLDGHRVSVMTDRYGHAFMGALPVSRLSKFSVIHPVYSAYESDGETNLPHTEARIVLHKRGSLVANVSGDPLIPGVTPEVYLLRAPLLPGQTSPPDNSFEEASRRTVTAGKAAFPNLSPGWYKVAYADSGVYAESDVIKMESGSGDHEIDLELPEGNHLLGIVRDADSGQGIPGANVRVQPGGIIGGIVDRATQNATTTQDGAFELYNAGVGSLRVRVIAAGYPDYEGTVSLAAGEELIIDLSNTPATVAGRVTHNNQGVDGALLVLVKGEQGHAPVATAISDESGNFTLDGFPAGTYTLSVEAPIGEGENISRKSQQVEAKPGENRADVDFGQLVRVTGSVALAGRVPSRSSGEPVTIMFRGLDGGESKVVYLDNDGTYQTQLLPGAYSVGIEDREGRQVQIPTTTSHRLDLKF